MGRLVAATVKPNLTGWFFSLFDCNAAQRARRGRVSRPDFFFANIRGLNGDDRSALSSSTDLKANLVESFLLNLHTVMTLRFINLLSAFFFFFQRSNHSSNVPQGHRLVSSGLYFYPLQPFAAGGEVLGLSDRELAPERYGTLLKSSHTVEDLLEPQLAPRVFLFFCFFLLQHISEAVPSNFIYFCPDFWGCWKLLLLIIESKFSETEPSVVFPMIKHSQIYDSFTAYTYQAAKWLRCQVWIHSDPSWTVWIVFIQWEYGRPVSILWGERSFGQGWVLTNTGSCCRLRVGDANRAVQSDHRDFKSSILHIHLEKLQFESFLVMVLVGTNSC